MSKYIPSDWIFVIVGVGFMLLPLQRVRIRAYWANRVCVYTGIFTLAKGITCLLLDCHFVAPDRTVFDFINTTLRLTFNGFYVGVVFTLIVAGQLRGSKTESAPGSEP